MTEENGSSRPESPASTTPGEERLPWEWPADPAAREPWLAGVSQRSSVERGATRLERGRGRVRHLDPAYVTASRLAGALFTGFVALGCLVSGVVVFVGTDLGDPWRWLIVVALALLLLIVGWLGYAWPAKEYARIAYRVGTQGIEIKRGVLWRHVVHVPRSRIQHTDVAQGPIQRRFGLASLVVHTAGTHEYEVTLSGVPHAEALSLRDALLEARGDGA